MNLHCRLSEELEKTTLTRAEKIQVLTCVAVTQQVLQKERDKSLSPISYKVPLETIAKLLRAIPAKFPYNKFPHKI